MIEVAPNATFETSVDWGVTGLAGTLRYRLLNGAGGTTIAATTTGIAEFPASSGRYEVTITAPGTAGQYAVMWDDGSVSVGHTALGDDVLVTTQAGAVVGGTSNLYVTAAEIKAAMGMTGETFADDDIDACIAAASRACDAYRRDISPFYPTTATRYYTPCAGDRRININALNTVTAVTVDTAADYTYATTWTEGTEFWLEPNNAVADGVPYTRLALIPQAFAWFPWHPRSVKVTGSFGWAETPIMVKQAAKEYALFMLHKTRNAPLAIVLADAMTAARTGAIDPNVAFLLNQVQARTDYVGSIQLG